MIRKVIKKQGNSEHCFVCGVANEAGMNANIYELDDGSVVGTLTAKAIHQSYPKTIHGGISAALLDEVINRAISTHEPETVSVTVEIVTQLYKPVPFDVPLLVAARVTENTQRWYTGEGAIILPDGSIPVRGTVKCVKLRPETADSFGDAGYMVKGTLENEPTEFELPDNLWTQKTEK